MEKNSSRACGICDKNFPNGRALGGHMRSHFVKLPIPPKPETNNQALDNSAEVTQCAIQSAPSLPYHPPKKPTQDFQSSEGNVFAFLANSSRELELGLYPKNPTGKRSKCRRRNTKAEPKQLSPIPESLQVEEAATNLVMLSKDKWPESEEIETPKMEAEDSENGRDDSLIQTPQARFKCEICGKMFRSHQALGGHKANHKKHKNQSQQGGDSEDDQSDDTGDVGKKLFECPSCFRLFKTAQALGKHKKTHFSNSMVANANTDANEFGGMSVVDCNFPAPGEDAVASHIEILGDQ